jgi:acyl-CoA synthetase (AMP-forming)/AMP-acid ligase II
MESRSGLIGFDALPKSTAGKVLRKELKAEEMAKRKKS